MKVEDGFQPVIPPAWHPYTTDLVLPSLLKRLLPEHVLKVVEPDLIRFGHRVIGPIRALARITYPPTLTQYDQWGRRIDLLSTSEGWRALKDMAVEEGLVAIPHERKYGEWSRIWSFSKILVLSGDSNVIMCPFSMTDGSARVISLSGTDSMRAKILPRLISRDPKIAFTSGQWMTEKSGGSDVSQTETIAKLCSTNVSESGPTHELDGFKWFSSATDSNMALALARTGASGTGSRGLSLFIVPTRFPFVDGFSDGSGTGESSSNGVLIHRLKEKLGTKIVPTAELSLNSSKAFHIGTTNQGIKLIAPVLNITRMHSATGSVGALGKALSIARSYATVRAIQGGQQLLRDTPIHTATLARVSLLYRGLMHFLMGTIHLLGKVEAETASVEEELRLRLLTPTIKAFAAENATSGMEECMAALGGQGYMEENIIPRLIRDSLVEKIWEGTINVLALDLIRASSNRKTLAALKKWIDEIVASVPSSMRKLVQNSLRDISMAQETLYQALSPPISRLIPRPALLLLGHLVSSVYLLEHAVWSLESKEETWRTDIECANRWCSEGGLVEAVQEVKKLKDEPSDARKRIEVDRALLYGARL